MATKVPRRVANNLKIVGEQIRLARLRRDLSIAEIAARATCSEISVMRVEKGASTVAIGIYMRILYAMNLDESVLYLAQNDDVGRTLQDVQLKNRQRASRGIVNT